jgi:hypothetical protein
MWREISRGQFASQQTELGRIGRLVLQMEMLMLNSCSCSC